MSDKKVSNFQTFGWEVFFFTANAAKAKQLKGENRPFVVAEVGRGK